MPIQNGQLCVMHVLLPVPIQPGCSLCLFLKIGPAHIFMPAKIRPFHSGAKNGAKIFLCAYLCGCTITCLLPGSKAKISMSFLKLYSPVPKASLRLLPGLLHSIYKKTSFQLSRHTVWFLQIALFSDCIALSVTCGLFRVPTLNKVGMRLLR